MRNTHSIEFGTLKIFSVVAESESLTQAGIRLGITQSAVSQAIKLLEEQTDTTLVIRNTRPIKLTPSGVVLQHYADEMRTSTQKMLTEVKAVARGGLTELRVGMIDSFADVVGVKFVEALKNTAKKIQLRTGYSSPLSQALINRDLDILITSDPIHEYPELDHIPLLRDPFVIIAPEAFCTNIDVTPQALASSLPFIRYCRQSRIGMMTDVITRRLRINLNVMYELDSTQSLLRFVQSGQGWSIVSGLCLARYPDLLNGSRIINLSNGSHARYLSLMSRKSELNDLPKKSALICQEIYKKDILPQLTTLAPWLKEQAYTIDEIPII